MTVIVVTVAVVALIAGVAVNHAIRPRLAVRDEEPLRVADLMGPLQTLTVILLAFVLATAATSYAKAKEAVGSEASAVDQLAEVSDYAPDPVRQHLRADVVCYARAVASYEWPAMAEGHDSKAPDTWSTDFRAQFRALNKADPSFPLLVNADRDRSVARQARLAESAASVPEAVYWFMLASLAVTVTALGLLMPGSGHKTHMAAVALVTALLTSALLLIHDIERPFAGAVAISPTVIKEVERQETRDYTSAYTTARLPCDAAGKKL
ncbi:hypothetical protein [Streptomyces klenkii]|uniref:bestrophin-like domain n=1 Tax=Streptomyces klenkii TaxID=1420899 RepID=UPI003419B220